MKLEEITNQIYAEGVEKGKQEAAQIIADAKKEAEAIKAAAQKEAEELKAKAAAEAQELDRNTRSEIKMYTQQSLQALKTAITDLVCGAVVKDSIKAAAADAKFMQGIIATLAAEMAKNGEVVIAAKDADALQKYFAANAKAVLDKGVMIEAVKGLKTDFEIHSVKGGYKIAFGEAELEAYFKAFLRPQLIEELF